MIQPPGTKLHGKILADHLNSGGCISCVDFYRLRNGGLECMPEKFAKEKRYIWQKSLWGINEIMSMNVETFACLEPGSHVDDQLPLDITMEQKILNILGSKKRTGRTTYAVSRAVAGFAAGKWVSVVCPNKPVARFVRSEIVKAIELQELRYSWPGDSFEIFSVSGGGKISIRSGIHLLMKSDELTIYEHTEAERQLIEAARLYDRSVGGRPFVVHCKKSKFDVYVGRPTIWGNLFEIGVHGTRKVVVAKYRKWLENNEELKNLVKQELRGKILGCWCSTTPCHAEVLAEVANGIEI